MSPETLKTLAQASNYAVASATGVLALAFVATLGTTGMVTRLLSGVGINLYQHGFNLFTFSGLVVVYTYFQVPLMVILIAPALDGLRREWREAAENLGASAAQFWRMVGLPILAPALLASLKPGEGLPGGLSGFLAAHPAVRRYVDQQDPGYSVLAINLGAPASNNLARMNGAALVGVRNDRVVWLADGEAAGGLGLTSALCVDERRTARAVRASSPAMR